MADCCFKQIVHKSSDKFSHNLEIIYEMLILI